MKNGLVSAALFLASISLAAEPTPAERGRKALESTAFIKAFWPKPAYDAVWKQWGLAEKPKDYEKAIRERYGLQESPYPNNGYPMGLRKADLLIGKGVGIDCLTCHGGSLFGKSTIGLGNSSLDIHALFEEMSAAGGVGVKLPFTFSQARGTNEAGAFAVYLLGLRTPELKLKGDLTELGLHDDSCEDVPAWWLLKKKKTMYHVGSTDARSVRSIMQFLLHPLTLPCEFRDAEAKFRDIRDFILSIEPPKYPKPIDAKLAAAGEKVFAANCATCHGTYGNEPTYPNRIVPIEKIGTDRTRFDNIGPKFTAAYNASWFAKESRDAWFVGGKPMRATKGYQAPPLDGVWATAPYFHNGSVPTLDGVLNSKARPKRFTRSFVTDEADFDFDRIGWKFEEANAVDPKLSPFERRKIYDTAERGRGNGGHAYGDDLSAEERRAVIEYLKSL